MLDAKLSRRSLLAAGAAGAAAAALPTLALAAGEAADAAAAGKPKVYFTKDLSAAGLSKMAALVKAPLEGRIAVKLHTGEPNAPYILPRPWVKAVTDSMPGCTIVECNVAYGSPRARTETHRELLRENGWTFCPVDIMDAEGDVLLPVKNGLHLKEVAFGKHILDYDSMLVLTHFKGHSMGGYGGSLKNISIGCASGRTGKRQLHGSGWETGEPFMERMADGGKALADHFKG